MSVGLDADASSLGGEIICRTASTLLSNICGYQPSKFQRSRKYKGTGYFSVASKPYKPFGEILDLDSLGIASQLPNTDNEFHPLFSLATHSKLNSDDSSIQIKTSGGRNQHSLIKAQRISNNTCKPPPSINAGSSTINVGLCTTDWGRREVRAGACVVDIINRQKERKSFLHDCQQVKFYRQKTEFKKTHTPSVYLNGVSVQNSYKGSLVSRNLEIPISQDAQFAAPPLMVDESEKKGDRKRVLTTNAMTALASHYKHNAAATEELDYSHRPEVVQNQKKFIDKLEKIYSILCIVYNMKSSDLRSKRPLSSKSLKNLLQKPKHHAGATITDASFHHGDGKRGCDSININTNSQRHRSFGRRVTASSSSNHIKIVSPAFDPLGNYTSGRWTGASGRGTLSSGRGTGRMREAPPPWQRPIVFIDPTEEEKFRTPEERITACFKGFQQMRDEISYKLAKKIEEYDKNYDIRMASKLEFLKFGANAIDELLAMKGKSFAVKQLKKTGGYKTPLWFDLLEEEVQVNLKQPHFIERGTQLLQKLGMFIHINMSALPSILEKLCLYTFSIPAYQVCEATEIRAIKFVLEKILLIKQTLFNQWMEIRKLPVSE